MRDDVDRNSLRDRLMAIAKTTLSRAPGGIVFDPDDALVDVGFSSLDLANLMLAIEAEFDVMIPAASLTPANFRTVNAIAHMMADLVPVRAAAAE